MPWFALALAAGLSGCASVGTPAPSTDWRANFQSFDRLPPDESDQDRSQSHSVQGGATIADQSQIVQDVIIQGNRRLETHHILNRIRTRPGRYFDPDQLQQDVNELWRMKEIRRVQGPYLERAEGGIVITIDVVERPFINQVQYIGNRAVTDRTLRQQTGLRDGQPLDLHEVRMARHRIEEYYREKGFPRTEVTIIEGDDPADHNVIFLIHEDVRQRVWNVQFEGNTIASDARLRTFIKTKPGWFYLIGGTVNRQEIEQDILRLTAYYRSLGFFNARIGREITSGLNDQWVTIRYVIDEGPRYRVRSVAFIGNHKFTHEQLEMLLELKPTESSMPEFNSARMNQDAASLRDLYGSHGHVFAHVEPQPRFLETPGYLDLVYRIEEGEAYRVGRIHVNIDGEFGVTRRQTALNRLSLRPGDIIDIREIRASERRLRSSQIFSDTPGQAPQIRVRPPELDELERLIGGYD